MDPITTIVSRTLVLPAANVDTDQIIPARFLTTTSRAGLGKAAFADWRYRPDGTPDPHFVLNRPEAAGAQVLVAGDNFGCGSSREHAPWALLDAGLRAIVSTRFADIFRANATRNGLLPIVVDGDTHEWLIANPAAHVSIDLPGCTFSAAAAGGPTASFPFDPFAKYCLMHGVDELGYLRSHETRIAEFETRIA